MRISDWSSDVCSSDLGPRRCPLCLRLTKAIAMPFTELLNALMPPAERMRWEACLARHAQDYARNSDLVREGAVPEKMHIVLAGWAQRYKQLEEDRKSTRLNSSH